jgi:uncharacterized membrane protein YfcA
MVDDGEHVFDLPQLHQASARVSIGKSDAIGSSKRLERCVPEPLNGTVELHVLVATLLIGAAVGFVSGAFGKGGAAVSTPLLHAIGFPAMAAVASPLPATIPSTLLAGRNYARHGHVDRRILTIGVLVGVPLTAAGAYLTRWIPGERLVLAIDAILLLLAIRILLGEHNESGSESERASTSRSAIVIGGAALLSGLLGNSGGFLLAPLFISALHMPVRRALGTSLALAAVLAVPGTVVHAYLGHIDWNLAFVFGLASVPLASLGASVALRMRERSLTLMYGVGIALLSGGLLAFAR